MGFYTFFVDNENKVIRIIQLLAILTFLIIFFYNKKCSTKTMLKNISVWVGIAFLLLSGYSYQTELKDFGNRILSNIIPSKGIENPDKSATFYASYRGHFIVNGSINGSNIKFMVDTGASRVSLSHSDALKIGIDTSQLNYRVPTNTANGVSFVAPITIKEITISGITANNITAFISKPADMDTSLLGMSFLKKLSKYEFKDNTLTLWE